MQLPLMMNFILIPSAWMGAWVWEPVTGGLRALGHHVYPVTLSGLSRDADISHVGLATHVDDVLSILQAGDLRVVVVVGHLNSGIVAGIVADRAPDRMAKTVFVEAFLPHDGQSMLDAFSERQREDELRQIAEHHGRWPAPDQEKEYFVAPALVPLVYDLLGVPYPVPAHPCTYLQGVAILATPDSSYWYGRLLPGCHRSAE